MKMSVCAGAVALAMTGLLLNAPRAQAGDVTVNSDQVPASASIDVARIKSALHLTPAQEPYWMPVEAALRELSRRHAHSDENGGLVHRISHRVVSIVLDSATIRRLALAARPLIEKLDYQQMQTANGLAQEMGLGPVVAALR
jgi:hypothetical protein